MDSFVRDVGEKMPGLDVTLATVLAGRFQAHARRINELAAPLGNSQFWTKPFSFGNSFGHLVLHLTGNLNYYLGAQIAKTGYVRDRPREFADSNPPPKAEALKSFDEAVAIAVRTIQSQSAEDWSAEYSGMGTDAPNRLTIFLVCESHMQHHIGQMIYLVNELQRQQSN